MKEAELKHTDAPREEPADAGENPGKPAFQQPRLTFVKPQLNSEGIFTEVTAQFFGTFIP